MVNVINSKYREAYEKWGKAKIADYGIQQKYDQQNCRLAKSW